jgi:hypothetical protein
LRLGPPGSLPSKTTSVLTRLVSRCCYLALRPARLEGFPFRLPFWPSWGPNGSPSEVLSDGQYPVDGSSEDWPIARRISGRCPKGSGADCAVLNSGAVGEVIRSPGFPWSEQRLKSVPVAFAAGTTSESANATLGVVTTAAPSLPGPGPLSRPQRFRRPTCGSPPQPGKHLRNRPMIFCTPCVGRRRAGATSGCDARTADGIRHRLPPDPWIVSDRFSRPPCCGPPDSAERSAHSGRMSACVVHRVILPSASWTRRATSYPLTTA